MTQRRAIRTVGSVLGVTLMVAACGGGDAPSSEAGTADSAAPATPPPPAPDMPAVRGYPTERTGGVAGVVGAPDNAEQVTATIGEGRLQLSRDSVGGGPTSLRVENQGEQRHIVEVFSEHYGRWRSAPVPPGGSATMTMPLTYATYEVFCTVEGHRENGESATLRVQ